MQKKQFMRLKISVSIVGLVLAMLCIASCDHRDRSGKVMMRIASVLPADHPSSVAMLFFKERIEQLSDGQVQVRLFFNSQLGNAIETAEMVQMDNLEATYNSAMSMSQFVPMLNAFCMPFIFRDNQHAYDVVDGPIGELFREKFRKINFEILAFCDAGSRNIMTKRRPVRTPDDLNGMKIRVIPAPLMVDTINALGASGISVGQGEVYSALQTGVLDGWDNNPQTALSFRMYETGCIYYAHTKHLMIPDMLVISHRFYSRLEPPIKAWVNQAAGEFLNRQRQLWQQSEVESIENLKQAGMKFNEVEISLFQAAVQNVYDKYYANFGTEFESICRQITATP